ncbi:MAG: indole-3-glycerol phosphate synthase TrpC [Blastocatellia bacterium]
MKTRAELPGLLSAGSVLDRIVDAKRARLGAIKSSLPIEAMAERLQTAPNRLHHSLAEALERTDRVNIIAEIKRRSPSKGIICEDFDAARIAAGYAAAGAAAISVVCEEDFFGGSLDHLGEVREVVELPVLRKDFIIDECQVYESAAAGADAVLLITAILADPLLERLLELAQELGLDALVEVHSRDEMTRAVCAGATIIGVNNRDLTTFEVDLDASMELAALAPRDSILVSESGITRGSDIRGLKQAGFRAFLIGEHFMRADDPGRALHDLIGECG